MGYISKKGRLKYIFFNPKFKNSTNFERRISNSNIIRKQAILVIFYEKIKLALIFEMWHCLVMILFIFSFNILSLCSPECKKIITKQCHISNKDVTLSLFTEQRTKLTLFEQNLLCLTLFSQTKR